MSCDFIVHAVDWWFSTRMKCAGIQWFEVAAVCIEKVQEITDNAKVICYPMRTEQTNNNFTTSLAFKTFQILPTTRNEILK